MAAKNDANLNKKSSEGNTSWVEETPLKIKNRLANSQSSKSYELSFEDVQFMTYFKVLDEQDHEVH